ncbi:hypothetical protein [Mycobacterium vicinigordonae]|uniref:hypothetical protein n=1 Tax=Mycobacterium vicinigordonae TaxID=1719132 RepID=UPI001FEC4A9A|nr:hypothetical protein [Mycobacterium vicinigordonae]
MSDQFRICMKGDLAEHLPEFLEQVGLQRRGRLDDDWDQEFGRARLRAREHGLVELTLWRYEDDDWLVNLTYEKDPLPAEQAEQLRRKVLAAAATAGMTVTAQSSLELPRPPKAGMRYFVTTDETTGQPRPLFVVRIDDHDRLQVYSQAGPGWVEAPDQSIRDDVIRQHGWARLAESDVDAMLAHLHVEPGYWLAVTTHPDDPKLLVRNLDGRTLETYEPSSGRWEPSGYAPNPSLNDPSRWQPIAPDAVAQIQREMAHAEGPQ